MRVVELLGSGQCQSVRERWCELAQLETFEQADQVRIEAHDGSSPTGMTVVTGR